MKKTFTRSEVRALLKKQIIRCRNRFGRLHYAADNIEILKTLSTTKTII